LIFAAATLKPALDEVVRSYQAEGGANSKRVWPHPDAGQEHRGRGSG
jgi:hypothetical protein